MAGPFVKVDDQCRTSMRGVFAVGDLVGEPMLAHKSATQGEIVAEIIAGKARRFDPVYHRGGLLHRAGDRLGGAAARRRGRAGTT
jgi:hypothetical protein